MSVDTQLNSPLTLLVVGIRYRELITLQLCISQFKVLSDFYESSNCIHHI